MQEAIRIFDSFCHFFDAVIASFLVSFNGRTEITVNLYCRDVDNVRRLISLRFIEVQAWSFLASRHESSEVITEGIRFKFENDEWYFDFGDDPDVDLNEQDWTKMTTKWIIAKGIEFNECLN